MNFEEALKSNESAFQVPLSPEDVSGLSAYYSLLSRWNPRLHLVAPCSPEEFATRHVLESLMLLKHLPPGATIADIGSGAGLPIIPCLIVRPDLHATLIESSPKKSVFLREAGKQLNIKLTVIAKRFEDVQSPAVSFVTCRALDGFIDKLPRLIQWSPPGATLLLYGGETLRRQLRKGNVRVEEFLVPLSERRFLFLITDNTS